ncbi:MAG: DUF3592 domain-containing protein [Lactobacillales bacterium]|jgi:hypothetical protein|nr:DUF3592 domain-containing protein [Lactobacillales bacterium]
MYTLNEIFFGGLAMLVGGIFWRARHLRKCKYFTSIIGQVIDQQRLNGGKDSDSFREVITYYVDDFRYVYISQSSSYWPREVGTRVELLYNPENPQEAILPKPNAGLLFIVLGFFLTIFGGILWFLSK